MSHAAKRVDLRSANTQNIVSKVDTIIANAVTICPKARKNDARRISLDEMVGDSLALLGHTQYEKRRGVKTQPQELERIAALCSPNIPVTSLRFGNDSQQQLNNIKASNKISQASAKVNKSKKADYKGSFGGSGKHRSSDQYYKRSFHSQNHWRNCGDKLKKIQPPPPSTRRGRG